MNNNVRKKMKMEGRKRNIWITVENGEEDEDKFL